MLKINIYYVAKNKPVFLFKSGLKLIMRYASRIFQSKKTLHLSKIFTVKVLSLAAVLACKSLKRLSIKVFVVLRLPLLMIKQLIY